MTTPQPDRPHHRPSLPGAFHFESVEGGADPALVREAAETAAVALVRGSRGASDDVVSRIVSLADDEGLEALAHLWSEAPADSVAGCLWRLYVLRTWVYAEPRRAADEYARGRRAVPVFEAIAGVVDPPNPEDVCRLVDEVLAGMARSDFGDLLFRAAAFAHVIAAGRRTESAGAAEADRLDTMAEQLARAGHLELAGQL